jgi:hypothetical protein
MLRRTIVLVLAVVLFPASALPQSAKPAAQEPVRFVPGLEWFMNLIQTEHAKLWYAGQARNWSLAAYHLAEIKEIMSDTQDLVPVFRGQPFADMMDAVIVGQIGDLEKAVDAKNPKAFAKGFDRLTAACNSCHQAVGNGFLVIKRPDGPGFPNQDFRPH